MECGDRLPEGQVISPPLTLVAILRARDGAEEELGLRLRELVQPTLAEEGCFEYQLHRSNTDAGTWILYESWRSQADLDLHFRTPYVAAMLEDFPKLLRQDMELHFMTKTEDAAA